MLHGCSIGEGSLVGIQAVVLNGVKIGRHCIVGAGAVVTEGKEFPDGSLIIGAPAKLVRLLSPAHFDMLAHLAGHYVQQTQRHRGGIKRIA
jgi:carbonic anhydrase/acetyltransferase-like protein (isoleucine patch superfamily)